MRNSRLRQATASDSDSIWNIFHSVVASGDTYAFDPNTSREEAMAYWLDSSARCYVAEHDQIIVGTYILKPNQPGLGSHIANAAFMVAPNERGLGVGRTMGEHCLGEARRSRIPGNTIQLCGFH